jgi:hypothetical protein
LVVITPATSAPSLKSQSISTVYPVVFLSFFPQTKNITKMSTGQHKFQSFQTMTGASTRDQTIEERYGIPENFLEIEVKNPQTHGKTRKSSSAQYGILIE